MTSLDCQSLAAGAVCSQEGVCEAVVPPSLCKRDVDCGDNWAICRQGTCLSLVPDNCSKVGDTPSAAAPDDRERLPLGLLVPSEELKSGSQGIIAAALVAIDDINSPGNRSSDLPRVVAIACDQSDDEALKALVAQGKVQIVIGPTGNDSVQNAALDIAGQAVLFAPSADAPVFDGLALGSSLVSCKPNREDSVSSLFSAVSFMRNHFSAAAAGTTVLAVSQVERKLGFATPLKNAEQAAGVQEVDYDDPPGQNLVNALGSLRPSLLVAASGDVEWKDDIAELDTMRRTTRPSSAPYYLLRDQQSAVLNLVTSDRGVRPFEDARVFGLDYQVAPARSDALHYFGANLRDRAGQAVSPGLSYVYDCTYLATYAAIAALFRFALGDPGGLSPEAILIGLSALSGGHTAIAEQDISGVLAGLQAGRGGDNSVDLYGSSGDLDLTGLRPFDEVEAHPTASYMRPQPSDEELYCIDVPDSSFCNTGVTFPASGGAVVNEGGKCPCLQK